MPESSDSNSVIQPDVSKRSLTGSHHKKIGTDENAQVAIIWDVLKYTFVAGFGVCILLFAAGFKTGQFPQVSEYAEIWKYFIPIITAALGYLFGKRN